MDRSSPPAPSPVLETELAETAALMTDELGAPVSPDYLQWWYFLNPTGVFSFFVLKREGRIAGMATMNDFQFTMTEGVKLVGMPQKVLVAEELRGQGLFGALYFAAERENLQKKADFFLTFTNAASTPIFLKKFGYRRGVCPDLVIIPFDPFALLKSRRYEVASAIASSPGGGAALRFENGIKKDREFLRWRYSAFRPEQYVVLRVGEEAGVLGWVVLKKTRKFGLPFVLLMDLVADEPAAVETLVDQAALYCFRRFSAALAALDHPGISAALSKRRHRRIAGRFNFLVKGRDEEATEALSRARFSFSFGDLDFT